MLESRGILPEEITRFRRQRFTVDSDDDVASSLEVARSAARSTHVGFLGIHPVSDVLPENALLCRRSDTGICGRAITYLKAFLSDRALQVRRGTKLLASRPAAEMLQQESVLTPLLVNMALVALPQCLTCFKLPRMCLKIYADNIIIWSIGSARRTTGVRSHLSKIICRAAD